MGSLGVDDDSLFLGPISAHSVISQHFFPVKNAFSLSLQFSENVGVYYQFRVLLKKRAKLENKNFGLCKKLQSDFACFPFQYRVSDK